MKKLVSIVCLLFLVLWALPKLLLRGEMVL